MSAPLPEPAGIGDCKACPYLETGTSEICYSCARQTVEALAPLRCMTCDLKLSDANDDCGNPLCSWPIGDRYFEWNYAIAMRSGVLKNAISRFKYDNRIGWARIFARVLVGFLDDERTTFENFSMITACPTFLATDGERRYDHTRKVILAADYEADGRWPFDGGDLPAIVKNGQTERFVGKTWRQRKEIAEGALRESLSIPDPDRTRGKAILVYDDVFTDGFTLREVARCLRTAGGASVVCGVSLTRQPWDR